MECYRFSNSRFDIKSNGLISALPFIAQSFVCFFGGWITDVIITKKYLKTITVRKINTSLGLLVPAVTVVLAGKWLLLFHMMDSEWWVRARVRLDILRKEWSKLGLEVLRRAQKISVFGWLSVLCNKHHIRIEHGCLLQSNVSIYIVTENTC